MKQCTYCTIVFTVCGFIFQLYILFSITIINGMHSNHNVCQKMLNLHCRHFQILHWFAKVFITMVIHLAEV